MTTDIITIPINDESSIDQVLETMNQIDIVLERAKEAKASFTADLLEWVQKNGSFEFGGKTYMVGKKTSTKGRNTNKCLHALFDGVDGDIDALGELLKSDPFKQGASKPVLGDEWKNHFVTKTEDELVVKIVPTNLLPKGRNDQ